MHLVNSGVTLLVVSMHVGVMGNKVADKYAEQIKNQDNINIKVQYSKAEIKIETKNKGIWKYLLGNKSTDINLYKIQKNVEWSRTSS